MNGQQPKLPGAGGIHFTGQIFTIESAVVNTFYAYILTNRDSRRGFPQTGESTLLASGKDKKSVTYIQIVARAKQYMRD